MEKLDKDEIQYIFTTRDFLDQFNIDEEIINIKDAKLKFYFTENSAYLSVDDIKYEFASYAVVTFFLYKLSLNSLLLYSLSADTITTVANEVLQNSFNYNLLINKNTNQIITLTSGKDKQVNWKKVLQIIYDTFLHFDEKALYLLTHAGLEVSIKMSDDDDSNLDVLKIGPQMPSCIPIYRGNVKEEIPLRGYSEDEVLEIFKDKLEKMINIVPSNLKHYSVVRD